MNDLERELRELLDERSREARAAGEPPPKVLRRARRRQAVTVLGTVATVLAVVAGSIAGVSAVLRADRDREPVVTNTGSAQTRTSTIYGVTITYPEDWYLIRLSDEVEGKRSLFQLTNFDPGLGDTWFCPSPRGAIPREGVVLYVRQDAEIAVGQSEELAWTAVIDQTPQVGEAGCGIDASIEWVRNARSYQAFVYGSGPAYERVLEAFRSMRFAEAGADDLLPGLEPHYVLASGDGWNLVASSGDGAPFLTVDVAGAPAIAGLSLTPDLTSTTSATTVGDTTFVWGAGPAGTERVVLTTEGGEGATETVDLPPSFGSPFRVFVGVAQGLSDWRSGWELTAFDAGGNVLFRAAPPEGCPELAPTAEPPARFTRPRALSALRAARAAAGAVLAECGGFESYADVSPETLTAVDPAIRYDEAPVASTGVVSVRDVTRAHVLLATRDEDGNVWCLAEDVRSGTTYGRVDAATAEECVGGWELEPEPSAPQQASPQHGGTYWGVYVAIARAFDDPEVRAAEDRIRALGYTPGGGDISCDDGAREAFGIDPEQQRWVVAVYFDTQADAERFAAMLDPDPVGIARVTTYCLD